MRKFVIFLFALLLPISGAFAACADNEIDVLGDGTQCELAHFSVTTTNMAANTTFSFTLSASGTFYVDWGDGTIDTISRTGTILETKYSHAYPIAGVKTIRFGGVATGYSTSTNVAAISFYAKSSTGKNYIANILGNMSAMFPYITGNAANGAQPRFFFTFYGASYLTSISDTFFADYTTGAEGMYNKTFCYTGLTAIPAGLFSSITTGARQLFYNTFSGCSNLGGYIPPSTFAGLIENGNPTATEMWVNTFNNTQLLTTCPAGTTQYITGYEGAWIGKVSCEPCPGTLPENATYSTANSCDWTCDTGYLQNNDVCVECSGAIYNGRCRELCPVGRAVLHAGQYTYPLWSDKTDVPSPVLHIRRDENTVCYVYMEPGKGEVHGLKLRFTDNNVYHAIDPR